MERLILPSQSPPRPLTLEELARYTLWIGPLTPGELGPYPLPDLAWWLTPVDTPVGPLYTARLIHKRKHRLSTRQYAPSVLMRKLEKRKAYEYLVSLGASAYHSLNGVYLVTPGGHLITLQQLHLGTRTHIRSGVLSWRLVHEWWERLRHKPTTLPLEV